MNKKNYPQVYLEEWKYKVKKIHTPRFINTELESDTEIGFRVKHNNRELMIQFK